ncbi:flavin reductase family protein [Agromyces mediolanus]|uniref:Oxidoreductase n=1 Tax=Agromyces mediolanus TaxID=41986 RepID=A0A918FEJ7_AGRME|nr:flavin reductase family protein [Agromyces mediolanus]GGR28756.1 oxidoreductase [Agromyces mediolanus]GLJ72121.1 oxidoreductase [Agromyces mediolanus]
MTTQQSLSEAPQLALRRAFSAFPTGVVALAAIVDGAPAGMAVNSFTSISLEPPLVAVSVARTSTTWPLLADRPALGLSVLGSDQEALCRQLSSRTADRFAEAGWRVGEDGSVLVEGAALWLECGIHAVYDGGDHEIVLLEVRSSEMFPEVAPLVFHQSRFHALGNAG